MRPIHTNQLAVVYAQELLNRQHTSTLPIKPREGENILRIDEKPGFVEVVKREQGQPDAFLYHVRQEPRPEGGENLHWVLIGRIDPDEV